MNERDTPVIWWTNTNRVITTTTTTIIISEAVVMFVAIIIMAVVVVVIIVIPSTRYTVVMITYRSIIGINMLHWTIPHRFSDNVSMEYLYKYAGHHKVDLIHS